jgi:tRNA(Arg) A34 adenosine deaminase TadA
MQEAMKAAEELAHPGTVTPIGGVFVKDGTVILRSGNGSSYHTEHGCERKKLGIAGSTDYELCPGCSYKVHCEYKAVERARKENIDLSGTDVYLFGHFWYCESCCNQLEQAAVRDYYLLKDADVYFDRNKPTFKGGDFNFFRTLIK